MSRFSWHASNHWFSQSQQLCFFSPKWSRQGFWKWYIWSLRKAWWPACPSSQYCMLWSWAGRSIPMKCTSFKLGKLLIIGQCTFRHASAGTFSHTSNHHTLGWSLVVLCCSTPELYSQLNFEFWWSLILKNCWKTFLVSSRKQLFTTVWQWQNYVGSSITFLTHLLSLSVKVD